MLDDTTYFKKGRLSAWPTPNHMNLLNLGLEVRHRSQRLETRGIRCERDSLLLALQMEGPQGKGCGQLLGIE